MLTDPLLAKEDRAAILALDQRRGNANHGCRKREPDDGARDIQRTLGGVLPAFHRVPFGRSQTGSMPLKTAW